MRKIYTLFAVICLSFMPCLLNAQTTTTTTIGGGSTSTTTTISYGREFYGQGPLAVSVTNVDNATAPVPLDIYSPPDTGETYPVIVFFHGFCGAKEAYETIVDQLASHGFIVVVPQMYPFTGFPCTAPTPEEEAALGLDVLTWLEANLAAYADADPDVSQFGLSGHSRGGQVIYWMALTDPGRIGALGAVDPVDGLVQFGQNLAITGPLPLDFGIPTYVLGTGLGPIIVEGSPLACAPEEISNNHFFNAAPRPSWHVVATTHGHSDMIDEEDFSPFCPGGPDRDGMRSLTAGTLVAFFNGILKADANALFVLSDPSAAPVTALMERMTTRVQLESLTVTDNGSVTVEWSTQSEAGNTGFRLYRATSLEGPYSVLTALIAPNPGGADYSYEDDTAAASQTYYYLLEDVDTSGNSSRHGPVTNFSQEAVLINLASFTAAPGSGSVRLQWVTESEIENAGFNIYRSDAKSGPYERINPKLIPAQGSPIQGAAYELIDENVRNRKTYYYKLEDIDLSGIATLHGPVRATPRLIHK